MSGATSTWTSRISAISPRTSPNGPPEACLASSKTCLVPELRPSNCLSSSSRTLARSVNPDRTSRSEEMVRCWATNWPCNCLSRTFALFQSASDCCSCPACVSSALMSEANSLVCSRRAVANLSICARYRLNAAVSVSSRVSREVISLESSEFCCTHSNCSARRSSATPRNASHAATAAPDCSSRVFTSELILS